jgi:hypothetical protein
MYYGRMGYGNIVSDAHGRFLVGAMDDGPILDVDIVSDTDGMHVAADHGVEPYTTVVAHHHIAYDGGIVGDESVFPESRGDSFDGVNKWHGGDV